MWTFIRNQREGRFLLLGVACTALAFLLLAFHSPLSVWAFYAAILFCGYHAAKDAIVDTVYERQVNVDLLMVLSALGACLIGYESEGAMLLIIFATAEILEDYATNKSSQAITELMDQVPDRAHRLLPSGQSEEVATEDLRVGDWVLVQKGERLPIDGWADRTVEVNESSLTGESLPVSRSEGEEVFAGTINEGNAFKLKVSKSSSETIFSNIIRMVDQAQSRPSKVARTIDAFESKYVTGVLIAVPLFILALYLLGYGFTAAFYRGMVLLTVASPCALVASATPASLAAISNGAKQGILCKGGAAMESLANLETLFVDKTGTLTYGDFQVVDYHMDSETLAQVVAMEQSSSHPIAQAITGHFKDLDLSQVDQSQPVEEESGAGLRQGDLLVGKPSMFNDYADPDHLLPLAQVGQTTIFVGRNHRVLGMIALADRVRPQAQQAVADFQNSGVTVQLLTGDNDGVAQKVAQATGIDQIWSQCLPEDKIRQVTLAQDQGQVVGMIGDGINDAPALANADLGIAMGSGASIAMESGDIVIVKNDLGKLYHSYQLSHRLNRIIKENVAFAVGVIVILVLLNLLGWLDLPAGVVFHEGSTILVILNGLRLLKY